MDIISNLGFGLATALTWNNLYYCLVGAISGTLIGVLPGIGPTATIALLLPVTFGLEPVTAMIMLAGIYYGAQYGGSTTAILINLPGETSSVVTAIDGYRMARNGMAGKALATAAIASFVAGSLATVFIAFFAPLLAAMALKFGAPEYFALVVAGLIASVTLAQRSMLKAIAMIVLGILLGTIGTDLYSGATRFAFGVSGLLDGVEFVALAVGLFGVGEILRNIEAGAPPRVVTTTIGRLFPTRDEARQIAKPILRGTTIGSFLGVLPGGGHILASFVSYAVEKRSAKDQSRFGAGAIEGVAGPEAANNAAAQTSFIPLLTLGIPANAVMAMMMGALIIQGVQPGPSIITQHPEIFWGVIASMWVGNIMLLILNLPLVGIWIKLLKVPYEVLVPAILVFSTIGVFSINGNITDIITISFFGLAGYGLFKLECEPAPLLLGFVLGPLLEEHLRRALLFSRGDILIFIERPISAVLLAGAFILLVTVAVSPALKRKREHMFEE